MLDDTVRDALGQDLEAWTLNDPGNRAFSAPGIGSRTAPEAQRKAFHTAIAELAKDLKKDPSTWTWGRVHQRVLENLAQVSGLDYGPLPDRGDANTPLAAGGFPSTHGPSWRMVVDWGSHTFQAIYPGGQSENPASSWYTNRATPWFAGHLNTMFSADQAPKAATWDMGP
jgi:penicillin amidase